MSEQIKICVDVISPSALRESQRLEAINVAEGRTLRGPVIARAISPVGLQWPNGSTLRVKFIGGAPQEREMVARVAGEWTKHANLKLEFTSGTQSEIRVGFVQDGRSWSYVGTDNLNIPRHAATMNFGWQLDEGTILHEFGHAIGLAHEHQNPSGGIEWNEPVVIRDLSGPPNSWDEATIRHNVLNKYLANQVRGTAFDKHSIMLYHFPASWTLNGIATASNEKLSSTDKQFVGAAQMYPFPAAPDPEPVELPIAETEPVTAEIGKPGEEDLFKFTVKKTGNYTIETEGPTDVVMRLFGPHNRTTLIAEDDDSGTDRNARIMRLLEPGEYFVQVRHFSSQSTGAYKISVSR